MGTGNIQGWRNKMADVFTAKKRSKIMVAIKGRGTKSTEMAIRRLLRVHHISGWRSHLPGLPGTPDFVFPAHRLSLFIDGCFWHGCTKCSRNLTPSTNAAFWIQKITANRRRDRQINRRLRNLGWKVIRIWEHDVKNDPESHIFRIWSAIRCF
mgnify:CR=1 FL=1